MQIIGDVPIIDRSLPAESYLILWEIALTDSVTFWGVYAVLGKIIGVAVAPMMRGFWGVVLGLLVGHMFDKARSRKMAWFANQRERQALFLPPPLR